MRLQAYMRADHIQPAVAEVNPAEIDLCERDRLRKKVIFMYARRRAFDFCALSWPTFLFLP